MKFNIMCFGQILMTVIKAARQYNHPSKEEEPTQCTQKSIKS